MRKITFTQAQKEQVLSIIDRYDSDEIACRYLELGNETGIQKNVLQKIAKELREEGLITVETMFSEDGPGPYGKGFAITYDGRLYHRDTDMVG